MSSVVGDFMKDEGNMSYFNCWYFGFITYLKLDCKIQHNYLETRCWNFKEIPMANCWKCIFSQITLCLWEFDIIYTIFRHENFQKTLCKIKSEKWMNELIILNENMHQITMHVTKSLQIHDFQIILPRTSWSSRSLSHTLWVIIINKKNI
jgi:hypothetical protein